MTEHDSVIIKILIGAIIGALITYWRTKYTVYSSDFSKRIEILKPALALLKSEAKLVQGEDGTYQAFIGDKAMNDFIPDWLENGDGKFARPIPPTSGGGASGGSGVQSEQIDISKMTPNQMMAMGRENK